jgi:hypothetical protein
VLPSLEAGTPEVLGGELEVVARFEGKSVKLRGV